MNNSEQILQARTALWYKGNLSWKLDINQKVLYEIYKTNPEKILVFNMARSLGKSYLLCILAIEECLNNPKALVKFACGKQRDATQIIQPLMRDLTEDCPYDIKPQFIKGEGAYRFPNGAMIQLSGLDSGKAESLRGGCFSGETLIMTPEGPREIKDIQVGDVVFGFNSDGSVSPTKVVNKFENGIKKVTEIKIRNRIVGACTDEHTWLTRSRSNCQIPGRKLHYHEKQFKDMHEDNDMIVRVDYKNICGTKDNPFAYILGAMIGDGCAASGSDGQIVISSLDDRIPNYIAKLLHGYVAGGNNYLWRIRQYNENKVHSKFHIPFYKEWILGKTFRNKNFDWEEVNTWNRDSCLKLLAGLIDTDGSVYLSDYDNTLEIQYHSSNLTLINNIGKLILKLWNYRIKIKKDDRKNKYTQEHFKLRIRDTYTSKEILKEISPYIQKDYKRYLPQYDGLKHKTKATHSYFRKGNSYFTETYDLEVDNETHLYLTADGLVTHNSAHLCIIDEAGTKSLKKDLEYIVNSIMLPAVTRSTKIDGKIILASTPPISYDHPYITFLRRAELKNASITRNIYTNPRMTTEMIDKLADAMGGKNSPQFRREYLAEIIANEEDRVIPEFTPELQQKITKPWSRPHYFDTYVSMDIGIVDLTFVIFAYYDFQSDKVVIEDEFCLNGSRFTTQYLAEGIKEKERALWTDLYGDFKEPFKRVADNNLILINDLNRLHSLIFHPTQKDNAEAALNNMRMMLEQQKIIIHPRCTNLLRHLRDATWNKARTSYDRSADNSHYDGVEALKYLIRNIDFHHNPFPASYNLPAGPNSYYRNGAQKNNASAEALRQMLNVKKKHRF